MLVMDYGVSYLSPRPVDHDIACWLWLDDYDLGPEETPREADQRRKAYREAVGEWMLSDPWTVKMKNVSANVVTVADWLHF